MKTAAAFVVKLRQIPTLGTSKVFECQCYPLMVFPLGESNKIEMKYYFHFCFKTFSAMSKEEYEFS